VNLRHALIVVIAMVNVLIIHIVVALKDILVTIVKLSDANCHVRMENVLYSIIKRAIIF